MGMQPVGRRTAACVLVAFASGAAVLVLDGQIAPLSLTMRRAAAVVVLGIVWASGGIRLNDWRQARSAAIVTAILFVSVAPSLSTALVASAVAVATIELALGSRFEGAWVHAALVPSAFSYVALRFAADLVPRASAVWETAAHAASAYVGRARALDAELSFTALGGPAVVVAVLYLLWNWRCSGGIGHLVAAAAIPTAWFGLLAIVTPDAVVGPLGAFWRSSAHGLVWVGIAAVVPAVLPNRRPPAIGPPEEDRRTESSLTAGKRLTRGAAGAAFSRRPITPDFVIVHYAPLTASCLAAFLSGVCLVGTALIGPASGRLIRVHNYGGLDWDRPVFGQFGAFSGGMFGLLPLYCRAEGYEFDVIEHTQEIRAPQTARSPNGPEAVPARPSAGSNQNEARGPSAASRRGVGAAPSPARTAMAADRIAAVGGTAAASGPTVPPPAKPVLRYTDTIEPADLAKTQILVLINSPKAWSNADRRVILDFVAEGGSLLVLGDHTDVFGLMRGFNTLLGPVGIKFRFDSAYKARETWRGCQAAAPDLVAWAWDEENPGVAVGASLELSGNARPLLVGRYAFSDVGVRANVMGSFLGNYRYDPGEKLGDVVLVATTTYGRGRIVVWGDTSAFQGGLSSNYRKVVGPTLAWLSRPAAWTERPAVRIVAAIGLLAVVLWFWIVVATPKQIAAISVSLLLGMLIPWALSLPNLNVQPHVDHDAFLIDRSHMEATGHYEARVNSIGSLYTTLFRSGFRVLDVDDWDPKAVGRARGVAFVAPQKAFTRTEVSELLRAEENGAVVILTTGQPDSTGSQPLLEAHGLSLVPRPMGTVTSAEPTASRRDREQQPRFLDAWPIVERGGRDPETLAGVEVIYRQGNDVVALFRRVGKGGLLLISDTRFFSDMNVEDMSGYWLGNLALIHDLFKKYLGADPDAVKPLFRSPEKPR
jgi:hypothetical protein